MTETVMHMILRNQVVADSKVKYQMHLHRVVISLVFIRLQVMEVLHKKVQYDLGISDQYNGQRTDEQHLDSHDHRKAGCQFLFITGLIQP